ncbi:MAG TPA: AAA family ATPase [Polyangia bacterium]|jgi:ATP-dependent 26S proteasome regulatory subunit|nr:AAA family ATPase [Polyangia bacterium]
MSHVIPSAREVEDLIKARYPLLYIVSSEEARVEEALRELAVRRMMNLAAWSITRGFVQLAGTLKGGDAKDPIKALDYVAAQESKGIFVLRDFHAFVGDPTVVRKLRDLAHDHKKSSKQYTVVLLSPVTKIPQELEKELAIIDFDLPSREEIDRVVGSALDKMPTACTPGIAATAAGREQVVDAALGLTAIEAENVIAKSLVRKRTLDVPTILGEKKHIIRKSGILEYYEAEERLEAIGGLEMLKRWLTKRRYAFTSQARDFGLPLPRGILLIGVPGCGKSLTAKAVGAAWQMPLLRLDVGKIFGGLVGASEENIRKAIKTAEATAPSILWLDEMEKGFSGTGSSNFSDGGTTSRVFGTFVTWLQEKTAPVFVIATANNVHQLPPELMRKGRFDEIFFVDLPTREERLQILEIHLRKKGRDPSLVDLAKVVEAMPEFSGSEIEQVVVSALYDAFDENPGTRELTTGQLLNAAKEIVPLAVTMQEGIAAMREWARTRARLASGPPEVSGEALRIGRLEG